MELNSFLQEAGQGHMSHMIFLVMGHTAELAQEEGSLKVALENTLKLHTVRGGVVDVISTNRKNAAEELVKLQKLEREIAQLRRSLGLSVKG